MNTKALYSITYGLYVIGASDGQNRNAQIANTLIQVCSQPPRVSVCINKENLTHGLIEKSGAFSASILAQDTPLTFIGGLGFKSGKDTDKLQGLTWEEGQTGAPIVMDNALAYLEARVTVKADAGTHTIFVGDVVSAEVLRTGEPLTYAYYQQVKRGSTPKTAPSYSAEKKESQGGDKYRCTVCGYVYDPALGDPDGNIKPGTSFGDLPSDWKCPVCGASKDKFEKL